jgi:hypothetical protein
MEKKMWHHPKYYEEIKKGKELERQATSDKLQASSDKRQATSA